MKPPNTLAKIILPFAEDATLPPLLPEEKSSRAVQTTPL